MENATKLDVDQVNFNKLTEAALAFTAMGEVFSVSAIQYARGKLPEFVLNDLLRLAEELNKKALEIEKEIKDRGQS